LSDERKNVSGAMKTSLAQRSAGKPVTLIEAFITQSSSGGKSLRQLEDSSNLSQPEPKSRNFSPVDLPLGLVTLLISCDKSSRTIAQGGNQHVANRLGVFCHKDHGRRG
jgi:hypothetical protein